MFVKVNGSEEGIFTKECWADGDFSKYDKTLLMYKYAIHVVWMLAQHAPYFKSNPKEMKRLKGVLESFLNYVVIIDGHVFIMSDKMPSGVWATSLFNCIAEILIEILLFFYVIYVTECEEKKIQPVVLDFVALNKDTHDFFKKIALSNYGDDNVKCIAEAYIKYYSHHNITSFGRFLRMGITPARKHETILKCKVLTDIMFLKRVPSYNETLQRFVGKLELDSIGKMLAFTDSLSPEWEKSVLMNARRELAFHGPEIYYKFLREFNQPLVDINDTLREIDSITWTLADTTLPVFEE